MITRVKRKALNLVSEIVLGGLCQVSVHREGDNPSSMEGSNDLRDLISVERGTISFMIMGRTK